MTGDHSTTTDGHEGRTQTVTCPPASTSQNSDPSTQGNAMNRSDKPASRPTSQPTGPSKPTEGADTMQAIVHDTYGTAEVLRLSEVARPTIKDNEVLVRVHAAGLDRGTWHLMTGRPYAARLGFGFRGPRNPVIGRDVAGTVAAVGSAVTRFAVGDAVVVIGKGSFA